MTARKCHRQDNCHFVSAATCYMVTSSNGNIFCVTGHLCGEFTGELPARRPVTRSFDVLFDMRLNKRLSKQWWGWWFETSSRPLWLHSNEIRVSKLMCPMWSTTMIKKTNGYPWLLYCPSNPENPYLILSNLYFHGSAYGIQRDQPIPRVVYNIHPKPGLVTRWVILSRLWWDLACIDDFWSIGKGSEAIFPNVTSLPHHGVSQSRLVQTSGLILVARHCESTEVLWPISDVQ